MVKCPQSSQLKLSLTRQTAFALIVASSNILIGFSIGWTAVLPKLQEDSSKFSVTEDDVAWLASLDGLVSLFSCFVSGPLVEALGPRRIMFLALLPCSGLWLLQAFAPSLSLLYLGRGLLAVSVGLVCVVVQPLVSELSPAEVRGFAASVPEVVLSLGALSSYALAFFLPWDLATAASAVPFVMLALLMALVPESPYWLVKKRKQKEAEQSLRRLLGPEAKISEELSAILHSASPVQGTLKEQLRNLRAKRNHLPVLLLFASFVLREFGGRSAVFSYTVFTLRFAGLELDASGCAVLIGVIRVVSSGVSAALVDVVGRKPLLVGASAVASLASFVMGAFLCLEVPGATSWMALAGVILYTVSYGVGLGPVLWVYLGELVPSSVRSLGAAAVTTGYYLSNFVVKYVFLGLVSSLGLGRTLILFGGVDVLLFLLAWQSLPETRGRSLKDIEGSFDAPDPGQTSGQGSSPTDPKAEPSDTERPPVCEVVLDVTKL